MNDDKNKDGAQEQPANKSDEQELNVHNPLKNDDDKKITQEDIESEQAFKEAQTERD